MSNWLYIEKECEIDFLLKCNECNKQIEAEVVQDKVKQIGNDCRK